MVFDAEKAPRGRDAFQAWYDEQAEMEGFDDPERTAPRLRKWFMEMIETFPPMNGPLRSEDVDDPKVTDYGIGRSTIYASFAWSQAQSAHEHVTKLAAKHGVGFFNISSDESDLWWPAPGGKLVRVT